MSVHTNGIARSFNSRSRSAAQFRPIMRHAESPGVSVPAPAILIFGRPWNPPELAGFGLGTGELLEGV